MASKVRYEWKSSNPDNWVLNLQYLDSRNEFVSSSSDGSLNVFSLQNLTPSPIFSIKNAHESSINALKKIDDNTIASCSTDGIKIFDLRSQAQQPVHRLSNEKSSPFLSMDYLNKLLAGGTELVGVDAELHIWDLRNPNEVVKSYIDSHHDDITTIKFHPTLSQYLMSGSTDGYVNVYDLTQPDEDEALHQVINYESVHSIYFTQERRISILSHVETLSFYELNDTNYEENVEPQPNDLGDLRSVLADCEYVVDVNPSQGYITYGANSKQSFNLMGFNAANEKFETNNIIQFPNAHGEEVVRDVLSIPNSNSILTCGEDGAIRLWDLPISISAPTTVEVKTDDLLLIKEKLSKKEKKEKKEKKKEKKDKKEKKIKKDKKSKSKRFKPY
ncbi:WD40-repeat-containing domain protein [Scheffersomyces coipomensis]|uniref:WD40-repeat-containing domain protein n=1 Tax=Scheffersomyces coipomensis TaxID=1788519 RepID=UPI00315CAC6A